MRIEWLNLYVLTSVCSVGLVIKLISCITFYQINRLTGPRRRKPIQIYQYLLLYSFSEMLILLINIMYGVLNCGPYCPVESYVSDVFIKQYERFAKIFGCNMLNTFNVLIELKIAFDR